MKRFVLAVLLATAVLPALAHTAAAAAPSRWVMGYYVGYQWYPGAWVPHGHGYGYGYGYAAPHYHGGYGHGYGHSHGHGSHGHR